MNEGYPNVSIAAAPRLFSVNKSGSVPVVKDLSSDKWLVDSAGICDAVEAAHPEHKLGSSDSIPDVCVTSPATSQQNPPSSVH